MEEKACPCLHTKPCKQDCSCANPVMSGGCNRCCSYGSKEQQEEKAEWLAEVIDKAIDERKERLSQICEGADKIDVCAKVLEDTYWDIQSEIWNYR